MTLLDASWTAVELGAHDGVEHGAGVDLSRDLVDVADPVLLARVDLGDDLYATLLGLLDALDGEVGAQEALGEGDRYRHGVGEDLQHLGGELCEGAAVQVALLDEAEEHRLEVGIGALVDGGVSRRRRPRRRRGVEPLRGDVVHARRCRHRRRVP